MYTLQVHIRNHEVILNIILLLVQQNVQQIEHSKSF